MPVGLMRWLHHKARTVPWFGRLILRLLPDIHWTVHVSAIGPFRIRLRRNRSFFANPPLTHEGFMLGALKRSIRPGDVVYDVGANLGLYTRFMVSCFSVGKVVAFEPMPENVEELRCNLGLGQAADKVQVMPMALADTDGKELFQVDDISSASGTLDRVTGGASCQARSQYGLSPKATLVQVAKLDTVVESGQAPPPQVVKIDVEGAENLVLKGASNTLRKHGPTLVIELHGAGVARAVVEHLHGLNYRVFGYFRANAKTSYAENYEEIGPRHYPLIDDFYSLHHLIAAPDASGLQVPIQDFDPADYALKGSAMTRVA